MKQERNCQLKFLLKRQRIPNQENDFTFLCTSGHHNCENWAAWKRLQLYAIILYSSILKFHFPFTYTNINSFTRGNHAPGIFQDNNRLFSNSFKLQASQNPNGIRNCIVQTKKTKEVNQNPYLTTAVFRHQP